MIQAADNFRVALILGGTRSGKSRYALNLAERWPEPRLYLATAEAGDAEMAERIARHRRERGGAWDTREVPLELAEALAAAQGKYQVILVDCLTLWLSNLLGQGQEGAALDAALEGLLAALKASATPAVLVSNEVGWGIVPDNPLAREFRDRVGLLHQRLGEVADRVVLLVAGLPLILKPSQSKGGEHGI
ncbi:MAG: bifunctional adenosylcobinamide kinase/adenosylcobinamide-phosphate guanylyltransferase [Thermodesulfobacteriota bacterium]